MIGGGEVRGARGEGRGARRRGKEGGSGGRGVGRGALKKRKQRVPRSQEKCNSSSSSRSGRGDRLCGFRLKRFTYRLEWTGSAAVLAVSRIAVLMPCKTAENDGSGPRHHLACHRHPMCRRRRRRRRRLHMDPTEIRKSFEKF